MTQASWWLGVDVPRGKDIPGVAKMSFIGDRPLVFEHFKVAAYQDGLACEPDCQLCHIRAPGRDVKPVTVVIQIWTRRRLAWVDGGVQHIQATVTMPIIGAPVLAWIEEALAQENLA